VVPESDATPAKQQFCKQTQVGYRVLKDTDLDGYPMLDNVSTASWTGRKRVIVTGCYDWFHSGHVRFFEEVSELGDLIVVVGHDANIKLLKGEGHPMYSEEERRYMAGSIRFVKLALVSSGDGWLDAEPEIEQVHPDIYAVNEDGDRPEKQQYCAAHGIEYRVLKRLPKEGLPKRQSTDLRGF
jgi:cytidyltransferase-like protein